VIDLLSLLDPPDIFSRAPDWSALKSNVDIPLLMGASIALLASFLTVLSGSSLDLLTGFESDANRDLKVHGAANLVMGLLGFLPGTGTMSRSSASINAGAKTRAANIGVGVTLLLILTVLAPVVAELPLWATSGMLAATAL